MRAQIAVLAGLTAVGITVLSAAPARDSQAQTRTVSVRVVCQGTGVEVNVDPWQQRLALNDELDWRLTDDSDDATISVSPKRGNWPFAGRNPRAGGKGQAGNQPARSGGRAMDRGRHLYNITIECRGRTIVIDPEIIIGEEE
ncbi:MAG: hypothetical protein OEO20_05500 [Gemmatimonadota bacterium]|nr:hypothetical protein [Gemmatimonadota bacterium]MDH3369175.1 hypothetical protein [Gemmatimonadota bacterium]MDH3477739.1 hypothetical protein [Gemmatimonadota bacterium]MDH5549363.1 hypothetical protein [Gemmatimonadota bacterium]